MSAGRIATASSPSASFERKPFNDVSAPSAEVVHRSRLLGRGVEGIIRRVAAPRFGVMVRLIASPGWRLAAVSVDALNGSYFASNTTSSP